MCMCVNAQVGMPRTMQVASGHFCHQNTTTIQKSTLILFTFYAGLASWVQELVNLGVMKVASFCSFVCFASVSDEFIRNGYSHHVFSGKMINLIKLSQN